ncbi:hypothetical protein [Bradyrhizobium sp. 153]|uniref:hypothetical protein n=1 Tax=Bradyrhizobium sp. 153 TaxID=2782627 RepID=UPI001FF84EC3|nr:hypothetical protein [Bradyrhizobium sp. 153]MCK1668968.1 hypothetical protein [Bradyrhizobium sp. 153]
MDRPAERPAGGLPDRVNRALQSGICDSVRSRSLLSVASMIRQIGHSSFAFGLRGLLTVLLTLAYVMVGFAGEIACAGETLESADRIEISDALASSDQVKGDQGSKKTVTVVDHCYSCVPLLIPPPVLVAEPASKAVPPAYATPTFLLEDHSGLDTPPPKYRT